MALATVESEVASPAPDNRPRWVRPASGNATSIAIVVLGVAVGLTLGLRDVRAVLYDDAAITLRYAARISSGHGWTYNNGDRTNGASAPLYTMVLAFLHLLGLSLETAAKAVAVASFAAIFGLVARIAHRVAGPLAGVAAIVMLALSTQFRLLSMSGMESALAAALGLTAILLATTRREWLTGVVVGLAVLNKLDAGFLAVAVAVGIALAYRRLPWRLAVGALATFAPWAIFAQSYFGSVLPHSASEKFDHEAQGVKQDPAWILNSIRADHGLPTLILAAAAVIGVVVLLRRREAAAAAALTACICWPAFHILAFSYANLGAPYGWYTTVVFPPLAIAAACSLGLVLKEGWRLGSAGGVTGARAAIPRVASAGLVIVVGGYVVVHHDPELRQAGHVIAHGHQMDDYESFELTRKEAGLYLKSVVRPGQVVETCFGWPEYEAEQATIKETCPLSTRKPVGQSNWTLQITYGPYRPHPKASFHLVRTFESPLGDGSTEVYARNN